MINELAALGRIQIMSGSLFSTLDRSRTVWISEAADAIGVTPQTLQRWARKGYLSGIAFKTPGPKGLWKFKRAELETWYKTRTR